VTALAAVELCDVVVVAVGEEHFQAPRAVVGEQAQLLLALQALAPREQPRPGGQLSRPVSSATCASSIASPSWPAVTRGAPSWQTARRHASSGRSMIA
jgi:hypothetical protein